MVPQHLSVLPFFAFSLLLFLYSAETSNYPTRCPNFNCGKFGDIRFPFTQAKDPTCGLLMVNCSDQKIQLKKGGRWFKADNITEADTISINDSELQNHLDKQICDFVEEFQLSSPDIVSFRIIPNITLFKCNRTSITHASNFSHYKDCNNNSFYLAYPTGSNSRFLSHNCSTILLPGVQNQTHYDIKLKFQVRVSVSLNCSSCHFEKGGQCQINNNGAFLCANASIASICETDGHSKNHCSNAEKGKARFCFLQLQI